jgi:carboxymethylenebutenolidase
MGEMISFGDTGQYQGYVATSSNGSGPGVLVLQEWWGLVGHIKSVVDRFAAAGFTAMAPDLYHGKSTTEPDEAGSLMMALNIAETAQELQQAAEALIQNPATVGEQVGVVGFCMGGQLSTYAATVSSRIGAAVNFYGIHPNVQPDYSKLNCKLLGFFAEHDAYASADAVASLTSELEAAGKAYEFRTFEGTHHAFFNDDRPQVHDAEASEIAWDRMVRFFQTELS